MALAPGVRLGPYAIVSALGAGGMGEVWRARDTKLGREVAIKTLPEAFAADPDRRARFEREAKLLASLNHPNIGTIHGLEDADGTTALILELIEGDTLAARIQRGAIPVADALKLALQIAEALEAAHEKGIIHRDLKPANIKVTPDGKVKVLDFGLAKAFEGAQADPNATNSPTLSMAATQQGVILGTAAYMSPEQAGGEATDTRADIWSFGVVLFEMLTGRQLFTGKNVSHILAEVVRAEPTWNRLPVDLHPRVRVLLERCLEKEARDRLSGISDAQVEIKKVLADPNGVIVQPVAEAVQAAPQSKLPWVAAVVLAAVTGASVWLLRPVEPRPVSRSQHVLPEDRSFGNPNRPLLAMSPDGRSVVYNSGAGLYLRSMDALEDQLIPGTEENLTNPTFSPDGAELAFRSGGGGTGINQLQKIAVVGGALVPLADISGNPTGIRWDQDDMILFSGGGTVRRVSADGGEPELLLEGAGAWPQLLPDGTTVLFQTQDGQVAVQSLGSDAPTLLFPGLRPTYHRTPGVRPRRGAVRRTV